MEESQIQLKCRLNSLDWFFSGDYVPFYHGIYHHLVVGMSNHPVTKSGTSGDLTKPPQVRVAKNLDEDEDVPSLKLTFIAPENRQARPQKNQIVFQVIHFQVRTAVSFRQDRFCGAFNVSH